MYHTGETLPRDMAAVEMESPSSMDDENVEYADLNSAAEFKRYGLRRLMSSEYFENEERDIVSAKYFAHEAKVEFVKALLFDLSDLDLKNLIDFAERRIIRLEETESELISYDLEILTTKAVQDAVHRKAEKEPPLKKSANEALLLSHLLTYDYPYDDGTLCAAKELAEEAKSKLAKVVLLDPRDKHAEKLLRRTLSHIQFIENGPSWSPRSSRLVLPAKRRRSAEDAKLSKAASSGKTKLSPLKESACESLRSSYDCAYIITAKELAEEAKSKFAKLLLSDPSDNDAEFLLRMTRDYIKLLENFQLLFPEGIAEQKMMQAAEDAKLKKATPCSKDKLPQSHPQLQHQQKKIRPQIMHLPHHQQQRLRAEHESRQLSHSALGRQMNGHYQVQLFSPMRTWQFESWQRPMQLGSGRQFGANQVHGQHQVQLSSPMATWQFESWQLPYGPMQLGNGRQFGVNQVHGQHQVQLISPMAMRQFDSWQLPSGPMQLGNGQQFGVNQVHQCNSFHQWQRG